MSILRRHSLAADAKVRQVASKDKMEEERELFQKTLKDEAMLSEALVDDYDEARTSERNIEVIDDHPCY